MADDMNLDPDECLEFSEACEGLVQYRLTPPGTGKAFPRCEFHDNRRWERYESDDSVERYAYSDAAPPDWFDPSYAGESWEGE